MGKNKPVFAYYIQTCRDCGNRICITTVMYLGTS